MTASNKINLLVREDGTAELLIGLFHPNVLKQKQNRICRFLFIIFLLGLFVFCGVFAYKAVINKHPNFQLQYNVYYSTQTAWKKGKISFNEDDALVTFTSENVVTLSDGQARTTAVKINTTTPGLPSSVCLIRNDEDYGIKTAKILPKYYTLDTLMRKTISERKVNIVLHEDVWVPDVFDAVDFDHLPKSVQELCDGVPIFAMIPWEDDDDTDSFYDESDEAGKKYDVTNDEDNDIREPATTITYLENEIDENVENPDPIEEESQYYGHPPSTLSDDNDDDYYEIEREPTTIVSQSENENDWYYRQKRQVDDENLALLGEEDNNEEQAEKSNESDLIPGENDSYAELQCCHHCRNPYLLCSQICVPIQQLTYPYFYKSCKHYQCGLVMPCAWWRARAAGHV